MARELQCKEEYPVQQKIGKYSLVQRTCTVLTKYLFSLRSCHAIANIQTKFYGILKISLFFFG